MSSLKMKIATSLPAKSTKCMYEYICKYMYKVHLQYISTSHKKPNNTDIDTLILAIGISMRRGCFLITPRVLNLLVLPYVRERARALSQQTAQMPPSDRTDGKRICDL